MTRYFSVQCDGRAYIAVGDAQATIETVWASQKNWFIPGSIVTITDDLGNSKTFCR